jgi:hypothetical protein
MSLKKLGVKLGCKAWKWRVDCKRDVGTKNDGKNITLELHGEYEYNVIKELDKWMSLMKRAMESIIEWFEGVFE